MKQTRLGSMLSFRLQGQDPFSSVSPQMFWRDVTLKATKQLTAHKRQTMSTKSKSCKAFLDGSDLGQMSPAGCFQNLLHNATSPGLFVAVRLQ